MIISKAKIDNAFKEHLTEITGCNAIFTVNVYLSIGPYKSRFSGMLSEKRLAVSFCPSTFSFRFFPATSIYPLRNPPPVREQQNTRRVRWLGVPVREWF